MRSWPYYGEDNSDEAHVPWWARKPSADWACRHRWLVVTAFILVMWAAAAIGTYLTGVPG